MTWVKVGVAVVATGCATVRCVIVREGGCAGLTDGLDLVVGVVVVEVVAALVMCRACPVVMGV